MEGHLTKSRFELDHTDELPVLSEEAILRFDAAETPETGAADTLESSVEALRAALEAAEERWLSLESRLRTQDQAITELRTALLPPVLPAEPTATAAEPTQAAAEAEAAEPGSEVAVPASERVLLERIAALETYIAGRADRWREMEQEVEADFLRIAELETELAQRIAREQELEDRLHHESVRSDALRDKLRHLTRRLEETAIARSRHDVDGTAELVCLSSDLGERYVMDKDAITIGRAPECDIQITADFVSRQHATIRREDADTVIEDKSSTNGVYVNAVRIRRKALSDGDEITIGESRFRFVGSQPPP